MAETLKKPANCGEIEDAKRTHVFAPFPTSEAGPTSFSLSGSIMIGIFFSSHSSRYSIGRSTVYSGKDFQSSEMIPILLLKKNKIRQFFLEKIN